MKTHTRIALTIGLALTISSASAGSWKNYTKIQARIAEQAQYSATYLPRRYQTANVFDAAAGPGLRQGAAWLLRSRNEVSGRIMANVPTAGDPYTLWLIVFNNPGACDGPCDDPDIGNPATGASIFNGSGAISADNGHGGGVINIDFSVPTGNLPDGLFTMVGDGIDRWNGFGAQVTLVIDQHPPITPGGVSWIGDLTTTNPPGMGPAVNVAVAVFAPCTNGSCPPSVL